MLSTPTGDVELRIPKVRVGSFFPARWSHAAGRGKALQAMIMAASITGTSTHKVDDLVQAPQVDCRPDDHQDPHRGAGRHGSPGSRMQPGLVPAKVIADRLGHTSVRTVLDVYGHLCEGADEAAADRLDTRIKDRGKDLPPSLELS